MKIFPTIFAIFLLASCQSETKKVLNFKFQLPKSLAEVSGIAYDSVQDRVWCIEDSGNKNEIQQVDFGGKVQQTLTISQTENVDWEDLATDNQGNLYIGDFGNNKNDRQNLCIYKIPKPKSDDISITPIEKISFSFPEQLDFPPKKRDLLFDVEAFFVSGNNFYLITKNRSKNFDGSAFVYKIPNVAGTQLAKLQTTISTGLDFETSAITSAAISPDYKVVALLTHTKIIVYTEFKNAEFWTGNRQEIDLAHQSQKESICFKTNNVLLICDEAEKKGQGSVFEVDVRKFLDHSL